MALAWLALILMMDSVCVQGTHWERPSPYALTHVATEHVYNPQVAWPVLS